MSSSISSVSIESLQDWLACPISGEPFVEPVVDPCGHTFEKKQIEQWLVNHSACPISRNHLNVRDLKANLAVQLLMEKLRGQHQVSDSDKEVARNVAENNRRQNKVPPPTMILQHSMSPTGQRCVWSDELLVQPTPLQAWSDAEEQIWKERPGVDLVLCLDISGSMGSEIVSAESSGVRLSRLDIVLHATQTIISGLDERDNFALVVFESRSQLLFSTKQMTAVNRQEAIHRLKHLAPLAQTNLMQGIRLSLEQFSSESTGRAQHLLLLTDGEPTDHLMNSHEQELQNLMVGYPNVNVHTFGFGYGLSLKSSMLCTMARNHRGMFGYIPDGSFVGTIFVNLLANIFNMTDAKWNKDLVLFRGQAQRVLPEHWSNHVQLAANPTPWSETLTQQVEMAEFRTWAAQEMYQWIVKPVSRPRSMDVFVAQIQDRIEHEYPTLKFHPLIEGYVRELNTEVTLAFQGDNWTKWGQHYVCGLARAHELGYCSNFKDPGVQHYANRSFRVYQYRLNDLFNQMPLLRTINQSVVTAPMNMAAYNQNSGGCIAASSLILMADFSHKPANQIVPGDQVQTMDSKVAIVDYVVATRLGPQGGFLCCINNLYISPWHPVYLDHRWQFPCHATEQPLRKCHPHEMIYNFILKDTPQHHVIADDIPCITLGHGEDQGVLKHEFFGTQRVVEAVKRLDVYRTHYVVLEPDQIRRNEQGLVCDYVPL